MKELDWIILTSWSPPPRTPQLQQAGPHCSLLSLYMCVQENGEPIPPARRHCISHMNVNHLFNWLPWLGDLYLRRQDCITVLLLLRCCFLTLPVVRVSLYCSLSSFHSLSNSRDWSRPEGSVTFDAQPSSCPPLSSLSVFTSSHSLYSFIQPFGPHMPC